MVNMIGNKLKELRMEKAYTQSELAKRLNVTRQAISLWEKDERDPDLVMLVKIAKCFSVTTDELLGADEL